jgi:hypothetical protein
MCGLMGRPHVGRPMSASGQKLKGSKQENVFWIVPRKRTSDLRVNEYTALIIIIRYRVGERLVELAP